MEMIKKAEEMPVEDKRASGRMGGGTPRGGSETQPREERDRNVPEAERSLVPPRMDASRLCQEAKERRIPAKIPHQSRRGNVTFEETASTAQ